MSFQSDYPDLDAVACRQIDIIFPRGSQSRMPDGSLPLERVAALGYQGLLESIAQTPTETSRMAGEYDTLERPEEETERLAGEISKWLITRGLRVDGWPRPPKRLGIGATFAIMPDVAKARSMIQVISDGRRALLQHEKDWLLSVLKKITEY